MSEILTAKLSIAPMIDWSYSHFRVFMRMLAPSSLVYTEMQTTGAILHNPQRALFLNPIEQPVAIQLGGSDPKELGRCAAMAEQQGFKEINLNLGCPSDRVQSGRFGACLMADADRVSACIQAMKQSVTIPVTAKIRIGIDEHDSYAFFHDFASRLVDAGVDKIIVHARKAWLNGLSPKQNRSIPPLHYDYVYRLKNDFQAIPIIINGHIETIDDVKTHLGFVDGVMIGRAAYQNPYQLVRINAWLDGKQHLPARAVLMKDYYDYLVHSFNNGEKLSLLLKPVFNIAHGVSGARYWKQGLTNIQSSQKIDELPALIDGLAELEGKMTDKAL